MVLAKCGLAKCGQIRMAKSGLAKCGHGRFSAASGALSLCPRPLAGVDVHSTPLPPPVCVRSFRGAGQTRFCVGERGPPVQRGGGGDLDLPPRGRLEVVVDGLPLFHGAQLAIDTTMVSPGTSVRPSGRSCTRPCKATERSHLPRALGSQRTRPVLVLGCEVGGRWSDECLSFLRQLSKARVRHEPPGIRASARRAWLRRWSSILACCASRSLALSLLEQRGGLGADGPTPSSCEVVGDDRYSS